MPVYAQQPMPPIVKAEVSFSPVRGHAPPEVEQLLRDTGWGFAGYWNGYEKTEPVYFRPGDSGSYWFWYEAVALEMAQIVIAARNNNGDR